MPNVGDMKLLDDKHFLKIQKVVLIIHRYGYSKHTTCGILNMYRKIIEKGIAFKVVHDF